MPVYLPRRGRLIEFRRGAPRDGLPTLDGAVILTDWARPARIVPLDFDTTPFQRRPAVEAIHEVWYVSEQDDFGAAFQPPENIGGAGAQTRNGLVLLYFSEEEALDDLS